MLVSPGAQLSLFGPLGLATCEVQTTNAGLAPKETFVPDSNTSLDQCHWW
jgi:hypothetical protein